MVVQMAITSLTTKWIRISINRKIRYINFQRWYVYHDLVYSNRNGALIYNSEKGIGVYGLDSIQEMTKDGKIVEPVIAINKKGSLFISPKETKLLVLNSEDLYFHSLDKDMP